MAEQQTHEPGAGLQEREKVLESYRSHVSLALARLAQFMHAGFEVRSQGPYVWDENGTRYLDCGGYGVFTLGHCHPRVVEAVIAQVRTNPLSSRLLLNRPMAQAAEALARVAPAGLDHVYFGVSGAEAVETALKLAWLNGRQHIIAMENGYHGMTVGALSVTGRDVYRQPFQSLLHDVEFLPFVNIDTLVDALGRSPRACVILEPVQAEGGVIVPPDGYLREVERACRAHDAFLIVDEIQTGLGRLGTWWGVDREGITPDLLLVGKALTGGVVPVSAVVGTKSAFHKLSRDPLIHNSTFSGAPISMAAAKAAIDTIEEENIIARAALLGDRLRAMLLRAVEDTCRSLVREIRGAGLLLAIEWKTDFHALDFLCEMLDRHVIFTHSMNAPQVTRITPPAILAEEDIEVLEAAIRASGAALANR